MKQQGSMPVAIRNFPQTVRLLAFVCNEGLSAIATSLTLRHSVGPSGAFRPTLK
jgi:hypothetical protein